MIFCANCASELSPATRFCLLCGTAVPVPTDATAAPDPLIGRVFRGVYSVRRRLGGGPTGDVYEATHVQLQVPIALRILNAPLLADAAAAARFHAEARACSRLRHPNITAITDFGQTDDGTPFIAMEYAPGETLARVLADEPPMPAPRVVRIGEQLLSALAEAHAAGVAHRSLTPGNVVLAQRRGAPDTVKVLDFGVGSLRSRDGADAAQPQGEHDVRSDLHAMGALLFQMLTGPVPSGTALSRDALLDRLRASDAPSDLEALVIHAITSDGEGPATADAMRDALLSCAAPPRRDARQPTADTAVQPTADTAVLPGPRSRERPAREAPAAGRVATPPLAEASPSPPVDLDLPPEEPPIGGAPSRMRLGASWREIGSILLTGGALAAIATAALAHFVSGDGAPGLRPTASAESSGPRVERPSRPVAAERPDAGPPVQAGADAPPPPPSPRDALPPVPELPAQLTSRAAPPDFLEAARRDAPTRRALAPPPSRPRETPSDGELCSRLLLQETLGEPRRTTMERECRR